MTDKEKQRSGQLYNPTASDICTMRKHGTDLLRQFNFCEDSDEQKKILQMLFSEIGENVRVNRPFYIDFGCHTHIGNRYRNKPELYFFGCCGYFHWQSGFNRT